MKIFYGQYVKLDFNWKNNFYENELYWPVMLYEEFVIMTEAPQFNRMTATGQDTDNKMTIYK